MPYLTLRPVALAAALGVLPPAPAAAPDPSVAERALLGRVAPAASYEARVVGATRATLRGVAEFGRAAGAEPAAPFVITLGAYSGDGAVVITGWNGAQPGPGTYRITHAPAADGVQVLIVTGSPDHPTGAFRAEHGTVTITRSAVGETAGWFDLEARGFLAAEPEVEDREVTARGAFTAAYGPDPAAR